ncbi:hypothetical protein ABW21_db0202856 [Orbilia brochopaga]|nr:hypothetical protein ABW21_db0202856 [Drechslerella brochopaga]
MYPLDSLYTNYPCRGQQIKELALLLTQANIPSPPALVLYGTEATGKSTITKAVLDEFDVPHAYIRCKECVTSRHLFEKALAGCWELVFSQAERSGHSAGTLDAAAKQVRPDSMNTLASLLQKVLVDAGKVVLVLDDIDKQKEITPAVLSGLYQMGRIISNLTIVMIVNVHGTRLMNTADLPSIQFPAYTKDECVKILSLRPMSIFDLEEEDDYTTEMQEEDNWLWGQSCSAIWDIMGRHAARNVTSMTDVMHQLWPLLIQPINDKEYGIRDFPKLLNRLKNDNLRNNEEMFMYARIGGNLPRQPDGTTNGDLANISSSTFGSGESGMLIFSSPSKQYVLSNMMNLDLPNEPE